jgi:hypothetical protein
MARRFASCMGEMMSSSSSASSWEIGRLATISARTGLLAWAAIAGPCNYDRRNS